MPDENKQTELEKGIELGKKMQEKDAKITKLENELKEKKKVAEPSFRDNPRKSALDPMKNYLRKYVKKHGVKKATNNIIVYTIIIIVAIIILPKILALVAKAAGRVI